MTSTPGSPFPVGGAGSGSGLPSQGAVQVAARGRLLLAAGPASNEISSPFALPNGTAGAAGIAIR
ncbi:MAG TPA: hypothetical protein VGF68_15240 [Solirubrobacteraceae bacterium]